jgi:outer membrane receptor protein involved in Fe transport
MKSLTNFIALLSCFTVFSQNVKKDSIPEKTNRLEEIVIAASKIPQTIKEAPVSIETIGINDIRSTSSFNYYDEIENLKGVDINTGSLTFKSINTRGFSTFANERFVQLIDGVDNSSPALNFVIGDFLALDDLDVKSIELLLGASSALYGANAYNGLLNITSKDPFDYQGISFYVKKGITSSDLSETNSYTSFGIRMAHSFHKTIAAKVSFSFFNGGDWVASNYDDIRNSNFTRNITDFDGLNIYGDEVATLLDFDEISGSPMGTFGASRVSRTGYEEEFLVNNDAENVKANFALHFRPFEDDFEIILNSRIGRGNTLYHSSNRFAIRNFILQHHKVEVKNKNFFLRSYLTKESAGNSYDTRFAAININRLWKSDTEWFTDYSTGYLGAITGQIPNVPAGNTEVAHQIARNIADTGRFVPGSLEFNNAFDQVISNPDLLKGAKFVDQSKLFHTDFNYDFSHIIKPITIQIGGSFRQYTLDSDGTIFTDTNSPIQYQEFGAYIQGHKKILDDKIQFTGSVRYDKSQNFDFNLSPRFSVVFNLDKDKNHYIRGSFQQAFRNPTTQDQYIGLDIGSAILVGSAPENLDRYISRPISLSPAAQALGFGDNVQLTGRDAYENAFTLESVQEFSESADNGAPDIALLKKSNVDFVKPEKISTIEFGYRGVFVNNVSIDAYAYYNEHRDFIRQNVVIVPNYGEADLSDINDVLSIPNALIALDNEDFTPFQIYTNSSSKVKSFGGSIGLDTKLWNHYDVAVSYTFAKLDYSSSEINFQPRFNTPEHKVKASIGARNLFKGLGFKINWRWNDSYVWESDFASGALPARSNIDTQINYNMPKLKSTIKFGGINISQNDYVFAPGSATIGSHFYISWTINN